MKGQVSVELIIVIAVALFFFILFATVFPQQLRDAADEEEQANSILKDLKLQLITASLSDVDYSGRMTVPDNINGNKINLTIYPNPDNLAMVYRLHDEEVLARIILPDINYSTREDHPSYVVVKKHSNILEVFT